MKIKTYRAVQALRIAMLINLILTVPAISQSKGSSTGKKGTGASSTGGIPVGTWAYTLHYDTWTMTAISQTTLTISADGTARYRTISDTLYTEGTYMGPQSKTTGRLTPAKFVGKNHMRWGVYSDGNKVKRIGNDLYIYNTGKDHIISSECDPPGITFEDINFFTEVGAARLKQTPASKQTVAVLVYHIQGDTLVCEQRDPPLRQVFQRVGSR